MERNGCPKGNDLDSNRKLAGSQYHTAIKLVKRHREEIIKDKLLDKVNKKKFKDFWAEVRKIKIIK